MLRGDHRRARETLLEAQAQDPGNAYIKNNLELLEASARKTKATQYPARQAAAIRQSGSRCRP